MSTLPNLHLNPRHYLHRHLDPNLDLYLYLYLDLHPQGAVAARVLGLGRPEGQGGVSAKSVLGSGLLGAKVVSRGAS